MHKSRKGAGRVFRATATAMVGDSEINGSARVVSALVADGGGGGGGHSIVYQDKHSQQGDCSFRKRVMQGNSVLS
jgi:hypothetical protein